MSDRPSTQITEIAKNPNGQCSTMSGTAAKWEPPNAGMHSTKNESIDPCSSLGHKSFEKK